MFHKDHTESVKDGEYWINDILSNKDKADMRINQQHLFTYMRAFLLNEFYSIDNFKPIVSYYCLIIYSTLNS